MRGGIDRVWLSKKCSVEKYRNTVEKYGEGAAIDKRQVMAQ